jgi:hypothetical protein
MFGLLTNFLILGKKNWEKIGHFFHVKNLMKFSIFWKKFQIFYITKLGKKRKRKRRKKQPWLQCYNQQEKRN